MTARTVASTIGTRHTLHLLKAWRGVYANAICGRAIAILVVRRGWRVTGERYMLLGGTIRNEK